MSGPSSCGKTPGGFFVFLDIFVFFLDIFVFLDIGGHALRVQTLVWTADPPRPLREPILVSAFEGLFDVGGAATGAVEALRHHNTVPLGYIDPDSYFDFSERRPTVRINEVGNRVIDWPTNRVDALWLPEHERDLVLLEGVEPHLMWRTFAGAVVEIAERLEAVMVITFGAMASDTPHTRPPQINGSTTDNNLAKALMLDHPTYEGPTGVIGVILDRLDHHGVPAVSLRASVPHYVSGTPNPKASRALLERFERVTGLPTKWSELDEAAGQWEARVNEAMEDDDDVSRYVRRLEERYDERASASLPNADDLAAEFERFLRRQDNS